jgi:hypothetical protein
MQPLNLIESLNADQNTFLSKGSSTHHFGLQKIYHPLTTFLTELSRIKNQVHIVTAKHVLPALPSDSIKESHMFIVRIMTRCKITPNCWSKGLDPWSREYAFLVDLVSGSRQKSSRWQGALLG